MVTILCIDDDPEMLQLQKAILGMKGYTVLTAPDGLAGIAITRTHSIDAVVTDFQMPGMNGGQVAELLMKENPTLPVVIYSGRPDEVPERVKCAAYSFLAKGDGPGKLLSMVDQLIAVNGAVKRRPGRNGKKSRGNWQKKAS
jgi:DNA-binding NtrC family response regulator